MDAVLTSCVRTSRLSIQSTSHKRSRRIAAPRRTDRSSVQTFRIKCIIIAVCTEMKPAALFYIVAVTRTWELVY